MYQYYSIRRGKIAGGTQKVSHPAPGDWGLTAAAKQGTLRPERTGGPTPPVKKENAMAETKVPPTPQEDDYTPDLITLEDEDGKEHVFEVIDAADLDDTHYMALVPYVEDEKQLEETEVELILMKVGEDENGEYLDIVEDDEELYKVSKMFEKRLQEFFDIEQ